jgi:hypothetical protein
MYIPVCMIASNAKGVCMYVHMYVCMYVCMAIFYEGQSATILALFTFANVRSAGPSWDHKPDIT